VILSSYNQCVKKFDSVSSIVQLIALLSSMSLSLHLPVSFPPSLTQYPFLLGIYKRRRVGRRGSFVWTSSELEMVCIGFRQFSKQFPLHTIAKHLQGLLRSSIKRAIVSHALKECERVATFTPVSYQKFRCAFEVEVDRIASRWIRFPSYNGILQKLRQCSILAISRDYTERIYTASNEHQSIWQMLIDRENACYHKCRFYDLPMIDQDTKLHKYGSCFSCGVGLDDKSEINFVNRCYCLTAEIDSVVVCQACARLYN
jgi:hypothetical protein